MGRGINGAFARVAQAHRVLFVPDMLAGVALNPDLNQSDGIHPTQAGVARIVENILPAVEALLAENAAAD